MGVEGAAAGLGAAGNIFGAYNANEEAKNQARLVLAESEREAARTKENLQKFMSDQESSYLKSGVILDGSPLLVLEETRRKGLEDINNIRDSARAQADSLIRQGRNQLIGSILFGGAQGALGAAKAGGSPSTTTYKAPGSETRTYGRQYITGRID